MQFQGKLPIGVVYNTSMDRPDAAFALALLYGLEGKRESRVGSICITGSGLGAAIFCDAVSTFYHPGPMRNANQALPVGLALETPMPPDSPMVRAVVDRADFPRTVKKVSDTSLAEAVLRNGVIFNAEALMVLSGPATKLAKSLDLLDVPALYKNRVKTLVVVDSGQSTKDIPAMRRILAEWPTPVVYCGREVGSAVPYTVATITRDFAWSQAHPVVEAWKASGGKDVPSMDMAAILYAVRRDKDLFALSEPGRLTLDDSGRFQFTLGGDGKVRSLSVPDDKKAAILSAYSELAAAKPAAPQQRLRPPAAVAAPAGQEKKP